jgi:hypothetical protein
MMALGGQGSLLVLFVIVPVAVGVVVMAVIGRAGPSAAPGTRTSELLTNGELAEAEVLGARRLGSPLDLRPMVQLRLEVRPDSGEPFELTVVQSMPRRALASLLPGTKVQARLGPGRAVGAVVPPG